MVFSTEKDLRLVLLKRPEAGVGRCDFENLRHEIPVLTQEFDKASELAGIQTLAAIERQRFGLLSGARGRLWGATSSKAPDASLARCYHSQ